MGGRNWKLAAADIASMVVSSSDLLESPMRCINCSRSMYEPRYGCLLDWVCHYEGTREEEDWANVAIVLIAINGRHLILGSCRVTLMERIMPFLCSSGLFTIGNPDSKANLITSP